MPPTLNLFYLLQNKSFVLSPFLLHEHGLRLFSLSLTLGRTRKLIPLPWYKVGRGGWMEPLPRVFDMLQYFETTLSLVESL